MPELVDEVRHVVESLQSALHQLNERSKREEVRALIESAKRRLQAACANKPELLSACHLLEQISAPAETSTSSQPGGQEEDQEEKSIRDQLRPALRSLLSYLSEKG